MTTVSHLTIKTVQNYHYVLCVDIYVDIIVRTAEIE